MNQFETSKIIIPQMKLGSAVVPIPLHSGERLQGHSARKEPAEGVSDPLYIHVLLFSSDSEKYLIIEYDLIEFNNNWINLISKIIEEKFSIKEKNIFIAATHIHTGPCTIDLQGLHPNPQFYKVLETATLKAIDTAKKNIRPVGIQIGQKKINGIAVNRRRIEKGEIKMKPNPVGDIDKTLFVIGFFDDQNHLISLLIQTAVHPTVLGVNFHSYSADYIGAYYEKIKRELNIPVMVMQGACGDVRPSVLDKKGANFIDGTLADCNKIAEILFEATTDIISKWKKLPQFADLIQVSRESVPLEILLPKETEVQDFLRTALWQMDNMDQIKSNMDSFALSHDCNEIFVEDTICWSEKWLERYKTGKLKKFIYADFAILKIGNIFQIAFLPGEAFSSIGMGIRKILNENNTLICGYFSGTVGYIPNKKAFKEGGYEVDKAYRSYNFDGPFSSSIEQKVFSIFTKLKGNLK